MEPNISRLDRQIVHSDPDIMSGIPVFIGTCVPLQTLFDYLESEEGLNEFSEDFSHLKIPAIQVLETIARVHSTIDKIEYNSRLPLSHFGDKR
jgi:uncharacterized protein (DUF433 family)